MAKNDIVGSVVTDFTERGAERLKGIFESMISLEGKLTEKAQEHTKKIAEAYEQYKKASKAAQGDINAEATAFGTLRNVVNGLGQDLKTLKMGKAGLDLVTNDDVSKMKQLMSDFKALDTYLQNMKKQKGITDGTLGLNPQSVKDATNSLKQLESAARSVEAALSMKGADTTKLNGFKATIEQNIAALSKQAEALRANQRIEADWDKAHAANIARDKGLAASYEKRLRQAQVADAEWARKREAELRAIGVVDAAEVAKAQAVRRRADIEDLARAKRQAEELRAIQVENARQTERQQAQRRNADIENQKVELKRAEQLRAAQLENQRQSEAKAVFDRAQADLRRAFSGTINGDIDAGKAARLQRLTVAPFATPELLSQQQKVRQLQDELVASFRAGNTQTQKHAELIARIIKEKERELQLAKQLALANNGAPTQAERNLNRLGGAAGASLLAIQAALSLNYSILNTFTGAVSAAVTNSRELESAFRNVQAVTATTTTEMGGLEAKIKSIAAGTKFSSIEMAGAALTLGQAGLSAKQIADTLPSVAMLAAASGTSLAQSVDLMTSVIGVFDKKATDAADVANKITAAANNSKVSVEKLAVGFQYAGNIAATMGVSFEETTAAMAAMANAGIKSGSTMGTGLRQFLVEVQKPSKEFLETMNRMGLSLADIDVKTHGLLGVAKKLREAGFVGADAIRSFDVRGAAAFNALIANPEDLQRQYQMLLNTKAGVEANEIQMNSFNSQATRLTTSLSNLASSGLEPVTRALTMVISGFATMTQAVSEAGVPLQIFTTLVVALAAAGIAGYLANMARGFSTLIPIIMAATGGLGAFTAAVRTITFSTGVGIAVGVITLAMTGLSYASGMAAQRLDELRAKSNETKAAFDESAGAVQSLTAKIESLNSREVTLRDNKEAVKLESQALTSQFGALGGVIDKNNDSFDVMVTKLRGVREEMIKLRNLNLGAALDAATKERDALVEDAESKLGAMQKHSDVNLLERLLESQGKNIQEKIGAESFKSFKAAVGELKANDPKNAPNLPFMAQTLRQLMDPKTGLGIDKNFFGAIADRASAFTTAQQKAQNKEYEVSGLRERKTNTAAADEFIRANPLFEAMFGGQRNVQDLARTGVSADMAKKLGITERAAMSKEDALKPEALMKVSQAIGREMLIAQEKFAKSIDKSKLPEHVALEIDTKIKQVRMNTMRNMQSSREEGEDASDFYRTREGYAQKAELSRLSQIPRKQRSKADQNNAVELIKKLEQAEFERVTKDMMPTLDPTRPGKYEKAQLVRDEAIKSKTQAFLREGGNPAATVAKVENLTDQIEERMLRLKETAEKRKAENDKAVAALLTNFDDIEALAKSGRDHMEEAGKAAKESLKIKQGAELRKFRDLKQPIPPQVLANQKMEMEELEEDWKTRISTFSAGFKGFATAAQRHIKEMTDALKKKEQGLLDVKLSGEDRIYAEGETLRALERERDLGIRARTPSGASVKARDVRGDSSATTIFDDKGVSVGVGSGTSTATTRGRDPSSPLNGTLKQRINRETIRLAQIELEENNKLLAIIGDASSGMLADYSTVIEQATKDLKEVDKKIDDLRAIGAGMNEKELAELKQLEARQSELRVLRGDTQSKENSARSQLRGLRTENTRIQSNISKNEQEIPQEVSLDNIEKKLKKVWATWQETVRDMDVMKVLGEGMTGVLGNITGALGNAFYQMASGTKSLKNAFKDMAIGIIQSMLQIMTQAMAMQAVKGLMGMLVSAFGVGGVGSGGGGGGGAVTMTADAGPITAATGGPSTRSGIARKTAGAGTIVRGIPSMDSVPGMAMPGKFMHNKKAVDSVGTDFLQGLSSEVNNVVSSSSPVRPGGEASEAGVVNVYVVTPDQKPGGMGPKDVVVVISDDIMRGGSIKQLIKQVQMGTA